MGRSAKSSREPPIALDRIQWKGEQSFRILSYYFSIRWNVQAAGDRIWHTMGDFAVPVDANEYPDVWAPGLPPQYSIVGRRTGNDRYVLFYGDGIMQRSGQLSGVMAPLYLNINSQTLRTTGDFFLVHAGAVSTPRGQGVLLPAAAGAGKTTLATALTRAGFFFLSDEGGALDPVSRKLYPYPRALMLKPGHAKLFPDLYEPAIGSDWGEGWRWIHPEDIRPGCVGGPCSIRFVIAHEYRAGARTEVAPMSPGQAAMELLTHSLNLSRYRARALPLVAAIARKSRNYRLVSGDLDEAVSAVISLTNGRPRA